MATHLGLTVVPKGFGSSFAGKTEADVPADTGVDLQYQGIGNLRIERRHRYRAVGSLLLAIFLGIWR